MKKYKDIHEYFKENLPDNFKIDKDLYIRLHKFRVSWAQKSDEYMEFLGGVTLGIQAIRFSSRDDETLFDETLGIDLDKLIEEVKYIKDIDPKWNIAGNPIYLTLVYLMHLYLTSKLPDNIKYNAVKELYFIYAYRVIGSLLSHYFKFQTTEAIAKATYEKLSNRYLIKRLNSWQEVFEYRANDLLPKDGLHYKRLLKLTTDEIVRITNDLQGRIREMVKNIYSIMVEIIEYNDKINSTTMITTDSEGGEGVGDITARPDKYIKYIRGIINLPDFVNDDLIYLVKNYLPTVDEGNLKKTLIYISNNVKIKPNDKKDFINVSIGKTIEYVQTKGIYSEYQNHIDSILKYMRGYFGSSSVKDKDILYIKKYLSDITKKAINKKTGWVLMSTAVGIIMYVFVRSMYKSE